MKILDREDLVAEADEMAATDPTAYRRYFLAMRAHNRINRGEDPGVVEAQTMPMLDSSDGWQA